jgi:hypothetical protein
MATQKPVRILYQAKNNTTGLTDVKAQIYLNGSPVAVGGSAITLTEVDATNSPGLYELFISGATLTGWGVTAGAYNCLEGYIDSVSKSAKAPFREELTVANTDDIDAKLGTPAGASVSADIAAIKSDTAAIKVDLETGPNNLANIYAGIQAIQNNAGFAVPVPSELMIPATGSNAYRIPVSVYNTTNMLIDPDSNNIKVGLVNQAGADRGTYLAGFTAAVAEIQTITTVADVAGSLNNKYFFLNEPAPGVGIYVWFNVGGAGVDPGPFAGRTSVMVAISSGASANTVASAVNTALNTLTGRFSSSAATNIVTATNSVAGLVSAGTAQNSGFTLGVSTAGANAYAMMTRDSLGQYHQDMSITSAAPEEELLFTFSYTIGGTPTARRAVTETINQASSSGFALQSTLLATQATVNNIDSVVTSGTFGNAAIKTAVDAIQTDITNNVEGAGFVQADDTLHQISTYMRANLFSGGRCV